MDVFELNINDIIALRYCMYLNFLADRVRHLGDDESRKQMLS